MANFDDGRTAEEGGEAGSLLLLHVHHSEEERGSALPWAEDGGGRERGSFSRNPDGGFLRQRAPMSGEASKSAQTTTQRGGKATTLVLRGPVMSGRERLAKFVEKEDLSTNGE